ncbi:MAG: adenylyltransferase/cytidyltransferase family protein [Spirochaetales bacterium]
MGTKRYGGIIIGRFMPPHLGHRYLVEFAHRFSGDVTVFVCTLSHEPIPGAYRYEWMRELVPFANVVHITEEIPAAARDQTGAYAIWADAVRSRIDHDPAYVFASESYGQALAGELGARFVPVDTQRSTFPISAGMIREDPYGNWDYIPQPVRPYYARKVVALDPTGALGRDLAAHFGTIYASDYAGHLREQGFGAPVIESTGDVVRAQLASEAALLPHVNRFLVTGFDPLFLVDETSNRGEDAGTRQARPDLILSTTQLPAGYVARCKQELWPVPRQVETTAAAAHLVQQWLEKLTKN